MSKKLKNITDNIMNQIYNEKIKIRPRIYFILGSIFTFIGLIASVTISVFLIGLMRFALRAHGPMATYRFNQIVSSFPWWMPIVAITGLIIGIWLLRRYDFSFKIDFKIVIVGFILTIIISGWFIDQIGLNDFLIRRGPMQRMMRQYIRDDNAKNIPVNQNNTYFKKNR